MAEGPGKYDDLCTLVRERANATGALVIVIGGDKGNGFSCQTFNRALEALLPDMLRSLAQQIEQDLLRRGS